MIKKIYYYKNSDVDSKAEEFESIEKFIDYCEGNDIIWQMDDIDYDCEELHSTCVSGYNLCFYSDNKDELKDENTHKKFKDVIEHFKHGVNVCIDKRYGSTQSAKAVTKDGAVILIYWGDSKIFESIVDHSYFQKYHLPFSIEMKETYATDVQTIGNKEITDTFNVLVEKIKEM